MLALLLWAHLCSRACFGDKAQEVDTKCRFLGTSRHPPFPMSLPHEDAPAWCIPETVPLCSTVAWLETTLRTAFDAKHQSLRRDSQTFEWTHPARHSNTDGSHASDLQTCTDMPPCLGMPSSLTGITKPDIVSLGGKWTGKSNRHAAGHRMLQLHTFKNQPKNVAKLRAMHLRTDNLNSIPLRLSRKCLDGL